MSVSEQIQLKSSEEIRAIGRGGAILHDVLDRIEEKVRPGVTTGELDRIARQMIESRGGVPAFLGYQGFPGTLCTSVNEEIVHGIPSRRVLEEGDIVSVDVGMILDGFYSDTARTLAVGQIDPVSRRLLDVTKRSLEIAISQLVSGRRLGDLSHAVQEYVEGEGFSVVREYAGHGIGRNLHEEPRIPNHGQAGRGPRWEAGMVVAIEPMVNVGTHKTRVLEDDWTVVTADGERSAHFEHTVAVTEDGPVVLT
jgi:methionyl aminopeptidase